MSAISIRKFEKAINDKERYVNVFYQLCVFYADRNSKMTTTAGHSFYIGPIGSVYNQLNDTGSWEPLVYSASSLEQQSMDRHIAPLDSLSTTSVGSGVMVSVLASSGVDRGFEPRSGQTRL
jgi:hypothetical protein